MHYGINKNLLGLKYFIEPKLVPKKRGKVYLQVEYERIKYK